jgi:hypothetical protein
MAEPDNHTLHLLREIRADILQTRTELRADIERLDRKIDTIHVDLKQNIANLVHSLAGEMAGRAYAVGGIEQRLADIEKRLSLLEEAR